MAWDANATESVARQIEHGRQYATRKGWAVADEYVYVDDGISGAEFANRPGFLRLMNALKPRAPFQVLVMSEESRLGREAIETAYALKQLVQGGVRVFFYLEDRERTLDSPTDKIMLSLATFNWTLRLGPEPGALVWPWGMGISVVTAAFIGLAAYLGGRLVYEHAVGVDTSA